MKMFDFLLFRICIESTERFIDGGYFPCFNSVRFAGNPTSVRCVLKIHRMCACISVYKMVNIGSFVYCVEGVNKIHTVLVCFLWFMVYVWLSLWVKCQNLRKREPVCQCCHTTNQNRAQFSVETSSRSTRNTRTHAHTLTDRIDFQNFGINNIIKKMAARVQYTFFVQNVQQVFRHDQISL